MTKESTPKKKNKETDQDQEEILKDQYEFGLNEETREKIEKEDDDHKEPDKIADEEDVVIEED